MNDLAGLPTKKELVESLQDLPDDASFDDVIDRLVFVYKVHVGIAQADQGMLIPHEEVMRRMSRWLK